LLINLPSVPYAPPHSVPLLPLSVASVSQVQVTP